ncbi:MAG TPA: CDP-diacylglycerol--glycerol-3-phosphate 3-phosphatidyltransferase [Clostridia bacterium]|nr:CDP-diacylglycerol--glycerol-3-phosphate 3-phosphatidyltransferase [Clostridia bacterium]
MNLSNKLTVARILAIPIIIVLYLAGKTYWAAAVFIAAAATDILDGYIARKNGSVTAFGKFFDPIADKILMLTALALLLESGKISSIIVIIILSRDFLISGLRLVAIADGQIIASSRLAKVKTVTQDIALSLLLLDNFPFRYINVPMDIITLYISLVFTIWSGIDYMFKNIKTVKSLNKDH